jgi:hypothetical protein
LRHAPDRDRPGELDAGAQPGLRRRRAGHLGLGIVWPAIEAARHRRWLWVVAIVVLSPFAGILWFILRRTQRLDAA